MPEVTSHATGAPCWFELGTTDQKAANQFYSSLFGWSVDEHPMGNGATYSMYKLRGRNVAACYTLMPDMLAQRIPPHWMVYFSVDRADEATAKVTELGGKVLQPAFDVFDYGRMAVCRDPEGAVFSVWEPKKSIGSGVFGDPDTVCWTELACRDAGRAADFYSKLLGWQTKGLAGMPYTEFHAGGKPCGGILQMDEKWGGAPAHWGIYFRVNDCDGTVSRIQDLGGGLKMPPFDVPNVGRIALAHDGQGAMFSIVRLDVQE